MLRRLTSGHVVWEATDGIRGTLSPALIKSLSSWSQKRFYSKEAGGLILGFVDSETNGLLAEEITTPGIGDRRSRTSFFRSERHQLDAEAWNVKTKGKGTQLGLWHTHPEANPTPSRIDLDDCEGVLRNGKFDCAGLLYLIVGTRTIGCWYACAGQPLFLLGHLQP